MRIQCVISLVCLQNIIHKRKNKGGGGDDGGESDYKKAKHWANIWECHVQNSCKYCWQFNDNAREINYSFYSSHKLLFFFIMIWIELQRIFFPGISLKPTGRRIFECAVRCLRHERGRDSRVSITCRRKCWKIYWMRAQCNTAYTREPMRF